jgi:hypothetical protein
MLLNRYQKVNRPSLNLAIGPKRRVSQTLQPWKFVAVRET